MKKTTIELTEKQSVILWSVFAWFQNEFPRTGLMYKFYDAASDDFRKSHVKEYDKVILKRIVSIGKWLETKHPELLNS